MNFEVLVSGFGLLFSVLGFWVSGFGLRALGFWFLFLGFGFLVSGFGSRIVGLQIEFPAMLSLLGGLLFLG